MKGIVFSILLFSWIYLAQPSFVDTIYTASLTPSQEVPPILDAPDSFGIAVCSYDRNARPPTLSCEVQVSMRNRIIAARIHVGGVGERGPVLFNFTEPIGPNFKGTWSLVDREGISALVQESNFLNGNFYINVYTRTYPSGEIRGQLTHSDRFYSKLSVQNTIPRSRGSSATGLAVGTYLSEYPMRSLSLAFVHSVENTENHDLDLRFGRNGIIGPLIYKFKGAVSPLFSTYTYTISEARDFFSNLHYLNLASERNPNGEIRGQIIAIDYMPEAAFTARLETDSSFFYNNQTTNRGCAIFSYNCETKVMEYLLMHDVSEPTGAFLATGEPGTVGIILSTLSRFKSPIYGSIQFTTEHEMLLYTESLYVMITSVEFPAGEIRGQISIENDWWSYLSGTNVVSPITTSSVGCATFKLRGVQNRILDYAIFHDVPTPLQATLSVGREGSNGALSRIFDSVFSPIRGNDFVFDDDELEAFVVEAMYVSVSSVREPTISGEIRGQIKRIKPCRAINENSLTVPLNPPGQRAINRAVQREVLTAYVKDAEVAELSVESLDVVLNSSISLVINLIGLLTLTFALL